MELTGAMPASLTGTMLQGLYSSLPASVSWCSRQGTIAPKTDLSQDLLDLPATQLPGTHIRHLRLLSKPLAHPAAQHLTIAPW